MLRRRLSAILALVSALLAMALVVLWAWSSIDPSCDYFGVNPHWMCQFSGRETHIDVHREPLCVRVTYITINPLDQLHKVEFHLLGISYRSFGVYHDEVRVRTISIHLLTLAALTAAPPLVWLYRHHRARRRERLAGFEPIIPGKST